MKPELAVSTRGRSENDPGTNERVPQPPAGQASPSFFRDTFFLPCKTQHFVHPLVSQKRISCETSLKNWKLEDVSENEAFVRDFRQKVGKPKMWKRSLAVRSLGCDISPEKVRSLGCEDLLAETKLLAARSLPCGKCKLWRCENCGLSWLRDLLALRKLESCEISWLWQHLLDVRFLGCEDLLAVRSLGCEISWLWDLLAVRCLGCDILLVERSLAVMLMRSLGREISWLWDFLAVRSLGCEISWAVRSLGCEISWLWGLLAVRSLGCEISWMWDLLAVRSLGCQISLAERSLGCGVSWLWDLLAVRSLGCEISWLWDLLWSLGCGE